MIETLCTGIKDHLLPVRKETCISRSENEVLTISMVHNTKRTKHRWSINKINYHLLITLVSGL